MHYDNVQILNIIYWIFKVQGGGGGSDLRVRTFSHSSGEVDVTNDNKSLLEVVSDTIGEYCYIS